VTWQRAQPAAGYTPTYILTPTKSGQAGTFVWDAQSDQAISDEAQFRVHLVSVNKYGPLQRTAAVAVSPPFRVRGTTCGWPQHPDIVFTSANTQEPFIVSMTGTVFASASVITYAWNFGDGSGLTYGQNVTHSYVVASNYPVTLTVTGDACPVTRDAVTIKAVNTFGPRVYLPLVVR
jgi:PKD repeat protein